MCFSWKTHENIGGSLNSVQYNSDISIFTGIPNVAFVNKRFGKKGASRTGFYCMFSCPLGSRRTADAHWGVVRQQPRVFQAQVEQCHSPALPQNGEGRARRARPLIVRIIRQKHGNSVSLGFTEEVQPASEGSTAQGRVQAHQEMVPAKNRTWEHV